LEEENTKLKKQVATQWQVMDMLSKRLEEIDPKHKGKMDEIRKVIMRERKKA
jgi:hypothetical protein